MDKIKLLRRFVYNEANTDVPDLQNIADMAEALGLGVAATHRAVCKELNLARKDTRRWRRMTEWARYFSKKVER